jgi:hypothetical protein
MKNLDQNFIDWACSLSGCNGGDPKSDIWVSGIEYGIDQKEAEDYYSHNLKEEISKGEFVPSQKYDWKKSLGYTYGRSLAKLYYTIKNPQEDIKNYKNIADKDHDYPLFKVNLYPIAFNSTDDSLWQKYGLYEITGFEERRLFKSWCFLHRFSAISKLVKNKTPKLIIGTGISYLNEFLACYAGSIDINKSINVGKLSKTKERKYYWVKLSNGTTIVVIPFFSSQSGLNSNDLLQEMGEKIRELVPNL